MSQNRYKSEKMQQEIQRRVEAGRMEYGLFAGRAKNSALQHAAIEAFFQPRLSLDDALLDIGCGYLESAQPLIAYLNHGCYHGLDIQPAFVQHGLAHLREQAPEIYAKLALDQLRIADGFPLQDFGRTFDAILAFSVFTHAPLEEYAQCIQAVDAVLAERGAFYFTVMARPHGYFRQVSFNELRDLTPDHLHLEMLERWAPPTFPLAKQRMVVCTRLPRDP